MATEPLPPSQSPQINHPLPMVSGLSDSRPSFFPTQRFESSHPLASGLSDSIQFSKSSPMVSPKNSVKIAWVSKVSGPCWPFLFQKFPPAQVAEATKSELPKRVLFQVQGAVPFNTISDQSPIVGLPALRFGSFLSSCGPLLFSELFQSLFSYLPHQWPGRICLRLAFALLLLASFLLLF